MSDASLPVAVKEVYKDYIPPVNAAAVVRTLLRYVPPKYLAGLGHIVLANSSGLSHRRRREKTWSRKRKLRIAEARGVYRRRWKGEPAVIEILVDNTVRSCPGVLLRVPPVRDLVFADVLYHELGHHIHTMRPEYRERENVAENWGARLARSFLRRRYWYLQPLVYPVGFCLRTLRTVFTRNKNKRKRYGKTTRKAR